MIKRNDVTYTKVYHGGKCYDKIFYNGKCYLQPQGGPVKENIYNLNVADIGGYIRAADKIFTIDGNTSSNRIAVAYVEPNTTYQIILNMDNRFRVCSYKGTPPNKTVMNNLLLHPLDFNTTVSQKGNEETMMFTTGADHTSMFIGYWANTGSMAYSVIRNSIRIYKIK